MVNLVFKSWKSQSKISRRCDSICSKELAEPLMKENLISAFLHLTFKQFRPEILLIIKSGNKGRWLYKKIWKVDELRRVLDEIDKRLLKYSVML